MKTAFSIFTIILIIISCRPKSPEQMMKEVQTDFAKQAEIKNRKILVWENIVDSIYEMANNNQTAEALRTIDNLISKNNHLDSDKICTLHFIKGDIYYQIDSFEMAVTEFTWAGQENAPKHTAARAGAYIKLKQYNNAFDDLSKAAEINYDYFWNLGNYYEITGNRDSAISCYDRLYNHDNTTYKFCQDRIIDLKNPKTKLLTELVYRNRERMVILLNGVK